MNLNALAKWIESHRFPVENYGTYLRVGIDWINTETGPSGVEWFMVRTLAEARDVLGY